MADVVLVPVTVQVPKEANDVRELLLALVADIKAKKGVAEITADVLPKLMAAVDGFGALADEAKVKQIATLAGLLGGQVGEILLDK